MNKVTVWVSKTLIEEGFKTGYQVKRCVVTKGLPKDAVLKDIHFDESGYDVGLVFETEQAFVDKEVNIELTTLSDVTP